MQNERDKANQSITSFPMMKPFLFCSVCISHAIHTEGVCGHESTLSTTSRVNLPKLFFSFLAVCCRCFPISLNVSPLSLLSPREKGDLVKE